MVLSLFEAKGKGANVAIPTHDFSCGGDRFVVVLSAQEIPVSGKASEKSSGATLPEVMRKQWVRKLMTFLHPRINWLSGGKLGNTISGDEVCFVTMKGVRTGKMRVIPLMYVPNGDNVLVVASVGGAPRNPVWYSNIAANSDVSIRHRGKSMSYRARLATTDEKVALWPVCDAHYAPYADYRKRTIRDIPIFVCEPIN